MCERLLYALVSKPYEGQQNKQSTEIICYQFEWVSFALCFSEKQICNFGKFPLFRILGSTSKIFLNPDIGRLLCFFIKCVWMGCLYGVSVFACFRLYLL